MFTFFFYRKRNFIKYEDGKEKRWFVFLIGYIENGKKVISCIQENGEIELIENDDIKFLDFEINN